MDQLQLLLRQLAPIQRIWIAAGALGSIVLLVVFVNVAGQPNWQPAFTGLSAEDTGTISETLRKAKIPFQVADAGSTILVAAGSLSEARVAAGTSGVLTDGTAPGFELFDKSGFGMSEFDQQVTFQRAKEGELARTIGSFEGVSSVRVSVVPAEDGLLADQNRPASASVVIAMRNGQPPDRAMVNGIVSTVAGSIAGLAPADVTVVDERGRVLAGPSQAGGSDAAAAQAGVERAIAAKVSALVDQALGPGHASVAVSASMDFAKVQKQITTYQPVTGDNWTPVSVHRVNESLAGNPNGANGGIAGAVSNVPGLPTYPRPQEPAASASPDASAGPSASPGSSPGASASPGSSPGASASPVASPSASPAGYGRSEETVNYSLNQTIETIVREPGMLTRLSVAVLVDEAAANGISSEVLQAGIEAAIGADKARGDVVSVASVPFAEVAAPADPGPSGMIDSVSGIVGTVLGVLLAAVLLFLVWRNMRALGRRAEEATLLAEPPARRALGRGEPYGALPIGAGLAETLAARDLQEPTAQERIQERLRIVADEKPDALVGLMHGWLREDGARK